MFCRCSSLANKLPAPHPHLTNTTYPLHIGIMYCIMFSFCHYINQPQLTTNPSQLLELCIVLDQAIYQDNPISWQHHHLNHKYWNYVLYQAYQDDRKTPLLPLFPPYLPQNCNISCIGIIHCIMFCRCSALANKLSVPPTPHPSTPPN